MTSRIWVWGLLVALFGAHPALANEAAAGAGSSALAAAKPAWCTSQAAEGVGGGDRSFQAVARKFTSRETISIVAIGSSSTAGSDLPDAKLAYPTHLERQINAANRGARVSVINKGTGGEAIGDTVRRFDADVVALKPDLVIWQLGANDIVRGLDMATAEAGVRAGLARLADASIPVVLMDSQAAPQVKAGPTRVAMDKMLRRVAREHAVPFWSRYDLMVAIMASGKASSADLTRADNLHMTVAMHVCTAAALGDALRPYLTAQPQTAQR